MEKQDKELKSLREQIETANAEKTKLEHKAKATSDDARATIEKMEKEHAVRGQTKVESEWRARLAEEEVKKLKQELTLVKERESSLRSAGEGNDRREKDLRAKIAILQREHDAMKQKFDSSQEREQALRKTADAAKQRADEATDALRLANLCVERRKREVEAQQKAVEKWKQRAASDSVKQSTTAKKLRLALDQLGELEAEHEKLMQSLSKMKQKQRLSTAAGSKGNSGAGIEELRKKLKEEEKRCMSLASEVSRCRAESKKAKQSVKAAQSKLEVAANARQDEVEREVKRLRQRQEQCSKVEKMAERSRAELAREKELLRSVAGVMNDRLKLQLELLTAGDESGDYSDLHAKIFEKNAELKRISSSLDEMVSAGGKSKSGGGGASGVGGLAPSKKASSRRRSSSKGGGKGKSRRSDSTTGGGSSSSSSSSSSSLARAEKKITALTADLERLKAEKAELQKHWIRREEIHTVQHRKDLAALEADLLRTKKDGSLRLRNFEKMHTLEERLFDYSRDDLDPSEEKLRELFHLRRAAWQARKEDGSDDDDVGQKEIPHCGTTRRQRYRRSIEDW